MAQTVGTGAGVASVAVGLGPIIAEAAPTHRQCTIEIMNDSTKYSLWNPSIYIESGMCTVPPSPFIGSSKSDHIQFVKTPNTAYGSVAVFTYELQQNLPKQVTGKVAVMFSVPYSFVQYPNTYAVGIFDKSQMCDCDLFRKMYYDQENSFKRKEAKELSEPFLIYEGSEVIIRAAMSDSYQPVIKLQVTDSV